MLSKRSDSLTIEFPCRNLITFDIYSSENIKETSARVIFRFFPPLSPKAIVFSLKFIDYLEEDVFAFGFVENRR